MIARALRLLHVGTWVIAIALAFLIVSTRSDDAPLQATATITVKTWTGSTGVSELRASLEQFGMENRVTFAQEIPDFQRRGAVRHLYLVDGSSHDEGIAGGSLKIGDFGGSMSTVVHPLGEAGSRSPLGTYDVFGDDSDARKLADFLTSQGMTVDLVPIGRVGSVPRSAILTVATVALLAIALVGAFVISGTRRYAVGRLHGLPYRTLLIADLRQFVATWVVSGLAALLLSGLFLLLRHGTSGIGLFLATTCVIQLALLVAAAGAHAIFLAMVMSVDLSQALKGELPGRALTATAYGLRLTAVLVGLGTVATTVALGADTQARDRSVDAFESLGTTSAITLGNAYTARDQQQLDETVGPWLRDADRRHDLLLAAQQVMGDPRWRGTSILIVNDEFLAEQPVRLAAGGELRAAEPDRITILVPDSLWESRAELRSQLHLDVQLRPAARPDYALVRTAANQRFFTYALASGQPESVQVWDSAMTYVTDALIVVVPSDTGWLSDAAYTAIASQGSALFDDQRIVADAIEEKPELERFVRGVTPVADKAAADLAEQTVQLRVSLFIAVISCLVVVMSGAAAALIHTRQMAQRLFVRQVFGWPFVAIHRGILILELVLLAGLLVWIPVQVAGERRQLEQWQIAGVPTPGELPSVSAGQLLAICLLALITSGGFLLSLALAHRRVVRGGVSEA